MSASQKQMPVYEPSSSPELFGHPSIFLSASIPKDRGKEGPPPGYTEEQNRKLVETAEPRKIREAVSHLCRFAFRRGVDLIFGGHPAITPMVLESARRFGGEERKRVVVFQSLFFRKHIPRETFELARWELGTPLWTAPRPTTGRPDQWQSLTWMREAMIDSPRLIAAVFIGGMEGVFEEAKIFKEKHPSLPCFAIGSTGSAAAELLEQGGFHGTAASQAILKDSLSYPLVLRRVFEDLSMSAGRPREQGDAVRGSGSRA